MSHRQSITESGRIVVKIGSALLALEQGKLFGRLAGQLHALQAQGRQVIVVSSGAIALGLAVMQLDKRPLHVAGLQAAAAAGQPELMRRWSQALKRRGIAAAQVLLTHADLEDRERFLNARHALAELLAHGVLPIINENDSVATEEIRVGDNDRLSAHVATLADADLLVILTSVDGLFTANPETDAHAERIALVQDPKTVAHLAGGAGAVGLGVGGMRTKIDAVRAAITRAIPVVIAHGQHPQVLTRIVAGADVGTLFLPAKSVASRKHWIGFTRKARGTLHIDAGAVTALTHAGKSLLPSGLTAVDGEFSRGSMVDIRGPSGPVGRGLVAYGSHELQRIKGHHSRDIAKLLGYVDIAEVVHRDDMVLLAGDEQG